MYTIKSYVFYNNNQNTTILYLHGWGCNHKYLIPFHKCTTITNHLFIDLPGFGENETIETPFVLSDFSNIIVSFIKQRKENISSIVGHSFGGKIAVLIAKELEVTVLFLIAPSIFNKRRSLAYYIKILTYKILKRIGCNKNILSKFGSNTYKSLSGPMKKTMSNVINENITKQLESLTASIILFFSDKDNTIPYYLSKKIKRHASDCYTYKIMGDHFAYLYNIQFISNIIEKVVTHQTC